MVRFVSLLLLLAGIALADPATAFAQSADAWPATDAEFVRGPGGYLSAAKILLAFVLLLLFAKTADWVSQDCYRVRIDYSIWNSAMVFPFAAAFLSLFVFPWYWLAIGLMIVAWLAPFVAYVIVRNRKVLAHQKVFTPAHIRFVLSNVGGKVGVKIAAEKPGETEKGPPVVFKALGGANDQANQANLIFARQSPGFLVAREVVADVLERNGDGIMLDYSAQGVVVKYQIDGVWHDAPPRPREQADPMLAVFKKLANRNENERRAKQEGRLEVELNGRKFDGYLTSQGTKTGEQAIVYFEDKKAQFRKLDELGMRPKLIEQLKEALARSQGFVLISTLPHGGLSTAFNAVLKECDRYMRDFAAIEDKVHPEHDVENVHVNLYDSSKGETPMTILPDLIRTYPNAYVLRDLVNSETVYALLKEMKDEERLIIAGVRAKEAAEALLRILAMKVAAKDFAPVVTAVVNERLIRKLCDTCKEAYPPPAEVVKQLGAAASKVEALYRPPQLVPGQKEKPPCPDCQALGYRGRTGIWEVLIVNDEVKKTLATNPKLDALRLAARKAGMRTLQEEGLLLVAKGTTSLQELLRVLKL